MYKLVVKLRMMPLVAFMLLTVACGSDDDTQNSDPSLETVKQFISELRTWSISAGNELRNELFRDLERLMGNKPFVFVDPLPWISRHSFFEVEK